MIIKIEKDVPIPEARGGRRLYPFADMQIGDSFVVPDGTIESRGGLYGLASRHGMKVTIRRDGGGIRVWRVA